MSYQCHSIAVHFHKLWHLPVVRFSQQFALFFSVHCLLNFIVLFLRFFSHNGQVYLQKCLYFCMFEQNQRSIAIRNLIENLPANSQAAAQI